MSLVRSDIHPNLKASNDLPRSGEFKQPNRLYSTKLAGTFNNVWNTLTIDRLINLEVIFGQLRDSGLGGLVNIKYAPTNFENFLELFGAIRLLEFRVHYNKDYANLSVSTLIAH
jgi:hypothetical protein